MRVKKIIFIAALVSGSILSSIQILFANVINPLPKPAYPSEGGVHQTAKIRTCINSHGMIGHPVKNPETGEMVNGFNFPYTDGIKYLNNGALWVGGVVDGDTLVSVSYSKQSRFVTTYGTRQTIYEYELYPPYAADSLNSMRHFVINGVDINHTILTDTVWEFIPPPYTIYRSNIDYDHWPLGLEITQKSYSKNLAPYKNIVLLDYTITNIGGQDIEGLSVGLYLDADICGNCVDTFSIFDRAALDDMVGSIREYGIGYMIDNDGDPDNDYDFNRQSPLDALAIRPVISSAPMPDTTFNWWGSGLLDYGPRLSATNYPDFGSYAKGSPPYDNHKYFIMRNSEWDYDQVDILELPLTDPTWEVPNAEISEDYFDGYDSRFLLSLNGSTLPADSSVRVIFALFGGEFVHTDPRNTINLYQKKIEEYKDKLFEDIIIDNGQYAERFAEDILDPKLPPLGLQQLRADADSINLRWDPWVFEDVVAYNLYYKPIPDSLIFAPGQPVPGIVWDDILEIPLKIETNNSKLTLIDLEPKKMYLVAISHQTESGEGELSNPIAIGQSFNSFMFEAPRIDYAYTTHYRNNDSVHVNWRYEDRDNIAYFKIYRTTDSTYATNRYYPFIAGDEYSSNYYADRCVMINDSSYCLYRMPAYDSVVTDFESDDQSYYDTLPQPGGIYWISAVTEDGIESRFSELITTVEDFEPTKEIVVVMGSRFVQTDFAYADSIINYYNTILEGYTYDIFNWNDTNLILTKCPDMLCTSPNQIADYKNVIIEEFPTPYLMSRDFEGQYGFFTQIALMGRNIIYFGIPPGDDQFNLSTTFTSIEYPERSFQHNFMGLDSMWLRPWLGSYNELEARDSLAGFHEAIPVSDQPPLKVTASNTYYKPLMLELFNLYQIAPMTPAFFPAENAEVLYTYHSYFSETSDLEALPCGVKYKPFRANVYSFPFHLWTIEPEDGRNLIDYIISDVRFQPPPEELPDRFKLSQNYPNPFNPTTTIEFELPQTSKVTLEIYNILGRKVKTLLSNETLPGGLYSKSWDGRDTNNNPVASGIYLYRLSGSDFTASKKMLLLK